MGRHLNRLTAALGAVAVTAFAGAATAQEAWVGGFAHDVTFVGESLGIGAAGKEDGFDVQFGLRSGPVEALRVIGRPRAYAIGSVNSEGDTSFGGAGLAWRVGFGGGRWYVQPGLGLVYHTGEDELPDFREPGLTAAEIERRGSLRLTENEYGSKVLFSPELSLGYAFSDRWAGELSYVHLSNGQILGQGQNDGLDMIGARVVHRFAR